MISGVVGGRSSGISNASLVMQLPAFSEGTEFRANEFGECVNHDGVVEVHVRVIIPDRSDACWGLKAEIELWTCRSLIKPR